MHVMLTLTHQTSFTIQRPIKNDHKIKQINKAVEQHFSGQWSPSHIWKLHPVRPKKPMTLWPFLFVHSVVYNIPRGTFPLLGFLTVGLIDERGRKRKAARSTAFRSPSEGVQEPNSNFYTLIISGGGEMPSRGFSVEWMENFPSVQGFQIDCMYVRVDVYVI